MAFDWHSLIELSVSPLEIVIRGSLVYLFLFAFFRTVLKPDIGSVGMADVLLLVLVADVKAAFMESDGSISVIRRESKHTDDKPSSDTGPTIP